MSQFILITGGAGYIGSHTICEIFDHTSYEVISIDNFYNSYPSTYTEIEKIYEKKIVTLNIDLCNKKLLFEQLAAYQNKIAAIIHFAAFKSVPESVLYPHKYYQNNIQSLLNIIEWATINHISNFIFSSSCSVYGDIQSSPVTEQTPLPTPLSPYAHTKQIGESILQQMVENTNLPLKILSLRYFNPVGAHSSGKIGEMPKYNLTGLAPNLIRTALKKIPVLEIYGNDYNTKDGTPIRDYVHVSDIAHAHVLGIQKLMDVKKNSYYDIINLGSGKGFTVLEVIRKFEEVTTISLNYRFSPRRKGDVEAIFANNDKALKELNWRPKYSLKEMLLSAWNWGKEKY